MQQIPNVPHGQARLDGDLSSLVQWKVSLSMAEGLELKCPGKNSTTNSS